MLGCDPCGLYCKSQAAGFFPRAAGPKRAKRVKKNNFTDDEYTLIIELGHEIITILVYVSITSIINVIFVKSNNPHREVESCQCYL